MILKRGDLVILWLPGQVTVLLRVLHHAVQLRPVLQVHGMLEVHGLLESHGIIEVESIHEWEITFWSSQSGE